MKEPELKRCPFCGSTKVYSTSYDAGADKFVGDVSCHKCGAKVLKMLEYSPDVDEDGNPSDLMEEMLWDELLEEARDAAIAAWNTRVAGEE